MSPFRYCLPHWASAEPCDRRFGSVLPVRRDCPLRAGVGPGLVRLVLPFWHGERSFGLPQSQICAGSFAFENFSSGRDGGSGLAAFGYLVLQTLPRSFPHRFPSAFCARSRSAYAAVLDPYGDARGHDFGYGSHLKILVPLSLPHGSPSFPLQPGKFLWPKDPAGKVHKMQALQQIVPHGHRSVSGGELLELHQVRRMRGGVPA